MNPQHTQHGTPLAPPSLETMSRLMVAFSDQADQQARQRFDELLPLIARQITSDEEAAHEAMASGGFLLDDVTVAIRFNEDLQQIELFCDVGLSQPHVKAEVHRAALEHNLCRTYPGAMLGLHPESGRLVATTSLHILLVTHEDLCVNAIQMLAEMAAEIRSELGLSPD